MLPSEHAILDDAAQSSNTSEAAQNDPAILKAVANQLEFEKGLLLERELTMQQIENCVLDINQIMKEIGVMVQQQGEDISKLAVLYFQASIYIIYYIIQTESLLWQIIKTIHPNANSW